MLEAVEDAGQPAVVPLDRSGEKGVSIFVGMLPGQPQCREFFDDFGVLRPTGWNALRQRVALTNPPHPFRELLLEFLGG